MHYCVALCTVVHYSIIIIITCVANRLHVPAEGERYLAASWLTVARLLNFGFCFVMLMLQSVLLVMLLDSVWIFMLNLSQMRHIKVTPLEATCAHWKEKYMKEMLL